jgi:diamine N-acetyltransferase
MLTLRPATPADAAAIAQVARASFTETFGHLYSPENLAAFLRQHTTVEWAAQIADPAYAIRLVEADGLLAGYAKLGPPSLPFTPETGAIELRQFYLLKPHHGTGFAAEMMAWVLAEARARGHAALYLSVFTDNTRARRFYARYGFEEVGPYTFKVGDHEDADIVMRLAL